MKKELVMNSRLVVVALLLPILSSVTLGQEPASNRSYLSRQKALDSLAMFGESELAKKINASLESCPTAPRVAEWERMLIEERKQALPSAKPLIQEVEKSREPLKDLEEWTERDKKVLPKIYAALEEKKKKACENARGIELIQKAFVLEVVPSEYKPTDAEIKNGIKYLFCNLVSRYYVAGHRTGSNGRKNHGLISDYNPTYPEELASLVVGKDTHYINHYLKSPVLGAKPGARIELHTYQDKPELYFPSIQNEGGHRYYLKNPILHLLDTDLNEDFHYASERTRRAPPLAKGDTDENFNRKNYESYAGQIWAWVKSESDPKKGFSIPFRVKAIVPSEIEELSKLLYQSFKYPLNDANLGYTPLPRDLGGVGDWFSEMGSRSEKAEKIRARVRELVARPEMQNLDQIDNALNKLYECRSAIQSSEKSLIKLTPHAATKEQLEKIDKDLKGAHENAEPVREELKRRGLRDPKF